MILLQIRARGDHLVTSKIYGAGGTTAGEAKESGEAVSGEDLP